MNPRKTFSENALNELADNIRKQGLLQPITVRPMVDEVVDGVNITRPAGNGVATHFEIVCGERRFRACKKLNMFEMPVIVREMSDDEAFDAMITENLQRRDVDPIEEAVAFRLLTERGQSTDELAVRFGKSVRYVQDRIRLGALIEPLRKAVSAGDIPLRGGYLLARLSEDDQKAYLEDEFDPDAEGDVSVSDIEDWLDRHFMNLWRAPFHDGETLNEVWNPDGSLIRRCRECECNTCNQGCLFADMKTEEPQCIDAHCYERKLQVYYDWMIEHQKSLILSGEEKPSAGRVALVGDANNIYNDKAKARFNELKEQLESQGFRVFTNRQLPIRVWGKEAEKEFNEGRAVRAINLEDMARGYEVRPEYYRIPGTGNPDPKASNYPSQLVERTAAIASKAEHKIENYAKKNFDRGKYLGRTAPLEEWEKNIIAAIIFDYVDYLEKDKLIAGTTYKQPTFQQVQEFRKKQAEYGDGNRWMRRAIAKFLNKAYNNSYFEEAIKQIDPLAAPTFSKIRKEANERIESIHEELKELGYDENGNKL